jgi:cardiolipin synthase
MKTSASSLVPLWDRAAEWAHRLRLIREANVFLYLSTFYIEYDDYGLEFLAAVEAARDRGVAVNLLIDGFGQRLGGVLMSNESRLALSARLDRLRASGAVVTVYRPAYPLQRALGGGQHVKIQVSDTGEAIFGSSNITRVSFERWNEYAVALRGPVVAVLLESYREIGGLVSASHLQGVREVSADATDGIAMEYWICNPNALQTASGPLGWRGRNVVSDALADMIDQARRSIWITSFYFKPIEPLIAALTRAAGRGVQVEVHHSHRDALPATELAWIAAAAHYDRLMEAGVALYENRHGEHSKIVLIDGERVAFGSYNFEEAAHDRLAEAMLASRDRRAVDPAAAIFDELRGHPDNALVTRDTLHRLAVRLKVKRALLGRFKRWM